MKTTYSSKMTNVTKDDANKSSNGIRESLLNNNFKDLIKKNPLETGLNKDIQDNKYMIQSPKFQQTSKNFMKDEQIKQTYQQNSSKLLQTAKSSTNTGGVQKQNFANYLQQHKLINLPNQSSTTSKLTTNKEKIEVGSSLLRVNNLINQSTKLIGSSDKLNMQANKFGYGKSNGISQNQGQSYNLNSMKLSSQKVNLNKQ